MSLDGHQLRLPRACRLKASGDFAALRQAGRREVRGCLVANWRQAPGGGPSRVGVIASRRIGSAVIRNRAKRLLREVFRLHRHDFTVPVEVVLIARSSIVGAARDRVEQDFLKVLRQAQLLPSP